MNNDLLKVFLFMVLMIFSGFMGAVVLSHYIALSCERDMSMNVQGYDYTCMKVAPEGLPKNNDQLKRRFNL
jgi:hypothetical protein